ncbi:MFS transporter [Moritella yayanosii]|uniref:Inner membrane transport protein YajR n=1 Tax=Moritella yayanosii TaxID=69539 RepID=A0A330LSL9_9GAMM|nr:MFS transporter [Moritella yayanosii]SQD79669.1 Inner membrane transport protein YajR [Moritella yayanosii]
MDNVALSKLEQKAAVSLALVFGLRMLGLFMIMPVFAIYGRDLIGYSPLWVGIVIGAYGLTQAILQIPMGQLSDRIGRKPVIIAGLGLFCLGSIVAGMADSVYGVAFGRIIQGTGAVASAILALAADITREQQRPKVMAVIGMCIGLSFAFALVAGPVLAQWIGLKGIFFVTAALAIVGMLVVHYIVPNPTTKAPAGDASTNSNKLRSMLRDPQLLRLDVGIFLLHLTLTAVFVSLPFELEAAGLVGEHHWWVYFPALLLSFVLMVPMLIIAAKKKMNKQFFLFAIALMGLALCVMGFASGSVWLFALAIVLYFTAFNFLEASLPAMISMSAPAGAKGSAMGIYSTSQFAGAFCGGIIAGSLYSQLGSQGLFFIIAAVMIVWFGISLGLENVGQVKAHTIAVTIANQREAELIAEKLISLSGINEAVVVLEEQVAYLKATKDFEIDQALNLVREQHRS